MKSKPDSREILSNYSDYRKRNDVNLESDILSEDEVSKAFEYGLFNVRQIIIFTKCENLEDYFMEIVSIRRKLEDGISEFSSLEERNMSDRSYNKIFLFIKGNEEKIVKEMKWQPPIEKGKIDEAIKFAKIGTNYCLDRFREDLELERARLNKAENRWVDRVEVVEYSPSKPSGEFHAVSSQDINFTEGSRRKPERMKWQEKLARPNEGETEDNQPPTKVSRNS